MNHVPPEDFGPEDQLPPEFVAALKEAGARRVFIPPTVDAAVLRAARAHLAPRRSRWHEWRRWALWPGLATSAALAVFLVYTIGDHVRSARDRTAIVARQDLNHDGEVDILDAYLLARQIDKGAQHAPDLDVNGDGKVDRRDAEFIAAYAVQLSKRS